MLATDALQYRYPGYDETYVFSFTLAPGEILGISGASGSGKSTLLDLVAGFLTPDSGDIVLDGVSILALPPERRPVSILFQDDNLFDHLSVAKNLGLARKNGRLDTAELETSLKAVGLAGLERRQAAKLSGGQKQRVALARCLLLDRPILLLDEPFSALDSETADTMRALVRDLVSQKGWHALLVSHQETDLAIADRCLRLVGGRLGSESD